MSATAPTVYLGAHASVYPIPTGPDELIGRVVALLASQRAALRHLPAPL